MNNRMRDILTQGMTDKEKEMFDVLAEVADERNREHLDSLDPDKDLTPEELQDKKDYLDDISFKNRRQEIQSRFTIRKIFNIKG